MCVFKWQRDSRRRQRKKDKEEERRTKKKKFVKNKTNKKKDRKKKKNAVSYIEFCRKNDTDKSSKRKHLDVRYGDLTANFCSDTHLDRKGKEMAFK